MTERPRAPRPTLLYRWYSICSSHLIHRDDCPRCNAGSWHFEPSVVVGRAIFRVSPRLWQKWANR